MSQPDAEVTARRQSDGLGLVSSVAFVKTFSIFHETYITRKRLTQVLKQNNFAPP